MIAAIKAEFRKLLTVRSTYVLVAIAAAFTIFYAGFIQGFKLDPASLHNAKLFEEDVVGALGSIPLIFGAIVAILLMTHEYRYNTIMNTMTSSNSRSRVLFSKFLAVSVFALLFTAFIGILSPLSSYIGVQLAGHDLVAQQLPVQSLLWRGLFYGWGYLTLALGIAVLIRSQIGAIVAIFVGPILETILVLLLKEKTVYLPFTSMSSVLSHPMQGHISYATAALTFTLWLVGVWVVGWLLFLKRDAN